MPFQSDTFRRGAGVNRRRYARHAVFLPARLTIHGRDAIACEIRDFCRDGLFIKTRLSVEPGVKGRSVEVSFSVEGQAQPFVLLGHVAHQSGGGLGVSFTSPAPVGALLVLQNKSRLADQAVTGKAGGPAPGERDVARACRQALDLQLGPLLDDFFARVEQGLLEAADRADSNRAQSVFFEAMSLLKHNRSKIEQGFRASVLDHAKTFAPMEREPAGGGSSSGRLSLVDRADFEDWLNLSGEIAKIEDHYAERLHRLEPRLSSLIGGDVNHLNNPYGPGLIEHCLRSAVGDLHLENAAKRVVYGAFSQALDRRLNDLYEQIDQLTRDALPLSRTSRGIAEAAAETPGRAGRGASRPVKSSALAAAGKMLALFADPGPPSAGKAGPIPTPSPKELIAALAALQCHGKSRGRKFFEPQALEAELARALKELLGEDRALEGEPKQTVQTVAAILENALAEGFLPAGIGSAVKELQLPILGAALADASFFSGESHPARDLLNLLDQLALATNGDGQIENAGIRQALDGLSGALSETGAKPEVFRDANAQLEQFVAPLLRLRAARYEQLQESCELAHRVGQAQTLVERALDGRIGGRSVPEVLVDLLDGGWRQLLVLALIDEGIGGPAWQARWEVLENLLSWLGPEGRTFPSLAQAHRWLDFVDEQLQISGKNAGLRDDLLRRLEPAVLDRSGTGEGTLPLKFVSFPSIPERKSPSIGEYPELARLRVGDWLKFRMDDGRWVPLRLSWTGVEPMGFAFANRRGGKALELGAEAFARQLRDGRAVPIESLERPLVERTSDRLVQSMQERLHYQASHDPVTELINRKEFIRRIEKRLADLDRESEQYVVCLVEIGQLRIVNHLCGMEAGDRLLREVSGILSRLLGAQDLLARMGDSSFGLLLRVDRGLTPAGRAKEVMDQLSAHHFRWEQRSFSPGVNLGLAPLGALPGGVGELLKNADAACLAARERGPNLIQAYLEHDAALEAQTQLMDWAGRIDRLFSEQLLFVRCQRIAPLDPKRGLEQHYEILLGIRDEQGRTLPPSEFILAAERWKRISEIDRWQLCSILNWIRENRDALESVGGFSVNLSGQSLNSESFLAFVHEQLSACEVPTERLTFEITETAAINDFSHAERFIRQVARYGCQFSLDDFGSGFASYSYLKNLHVDYLKIDGSFVRDIEHSATDFALVKSMNEIGHSLGVLTIAEYVESEAILAKLREIGVDYVQGYAIHKPAPLESLLPMVTS